MNRLQYIEDQVAKLKADGVYRKLPVSDGPCSNRIILNGREVVNLSSNNYLGLLDHPLVKQAAIDTIQDHGIGAGSVRTIVGNQSLIEQLEALLAKFKQEEAVTCFQSGLNCNLGVIPAITDAGDLILSDELNHASIIDGVRLSKADRAVYKHKDMVDLERVLSEKRSQYRNILIITDGVFSMDGDLAPLPEIVRLARQFNCLTYVDDAHGSGVLGKNGSGTIDHFHLHGEIDFAVGTLSKAVGVIGGYVCTKSIVKEWLLHRGRPLLFSTALPPSIVAATIAAVKLLMTDESLTKRLWSNAATLKKGLVAAGFDIGHSETPITPIMVGDEAKTMLFSRELLQAGVFASAIVFPTVAKGKGRLRVMISAAHTQEDIAFALVQFIEVGTRLGILPERKA